MIALSQFHPAWSMVIGESSTKPSVAVGTLMQAPRNGLSSPNPTCVNTNAAPKRGGKTERKRFDVNVHGSGRPVGPWHSPVAARHGKHACLLGRLSARRRIELPEFVDELQEMDFAGLDFTRLPFRPAAQIIIQGYDRCAWRIEVDVKLAREFVIARPVVLFLVTSTRLPSKSVHRSRTSVGIGNHGRHGLPALEFLRQHVLHGQVSGGHSLASPQIVEAHEQMLRRRGVA